MDIGCNAIYWHNNEKYCNNKINDNDAIQQQVKEEIQKKLNDAI